MTWQILHGDCLDVMRGMDAGSIDAIVTDPPYGIHFMNRSWDNFGGWTGKQNRGGGADSPALRAGEYDKRRDPEFQEQMRGIFTEALRVAKPGAHLVAFGSPRMFHRLTCAVEDAGWEVRDCLMYLYGSGFPKSHNVSCAIDKSLGHPNRGKAIPTASTYQACDVNRENKLSSNPVGEYEPRTNAAKQWDGWGTALKPAYEPIILARKPLDGTVAQNVLKWGTGALNIDGNRIGKAVGDNSGWSVSGSRAGPNIAMSGQNYERDPKPDAPGRWPANLILDEESAKMLDEQSGALKSGEFLPHHKSSGGGLNDTKTFAIRDRSGEIHPSYGDSGGASRFFYTSKSSRAEREGGLSGGTETVDDGRRTPIDNAYQRGKTLRRNTHPTVKPLDLMRWLVRLVTPPDGWVLDPFCGSGTTIMAARIEGFNAIGIDIEETAVEIARKRVAWAGVTAGDATEQDAKEVGIPTQLGLFPKDR